MEICDHCYILCYFEYRVTYLGCQNTIIVTASKIILDFIYTQCIYISMHIIV